MTNAHRDGLYMFILGSAVFIMLGSALSTTSAIDMIDYRAMYFPARCLIQHLDPYNETYVWNLAKAEGGVRPSDTDRGDNHFARYLYLPTTFTITVPFALLPWWPSRLLWMGSIAFGLVSAAFLMREVAGRSSPLLAGALVGFFLADNELLMVVGNVAGIAILLCILSSWCFVRERFIVFGILCFAASLTLKPHDSGLVWLYFFLAGGIYRKRALQTLATTLALSSPGVIFASIVSPNWIRELHANLVLDAAPGQRADPAIASIGSHGLSMMVNLQTVFRSFWSDPHLYNAATFLVTGPLVLIWMTAIIRSHRCSGRVWFALASAAALTMLPFYHRQYDTKLLLLTVPACAILWAEGGASAWFALVLNSAGFILTGDLSWIALLAVLGHSFPAGAGLTASVVKYAQIFSAPLILLMIASFYLWVYVRQDEMTPRVRTLLLNKQR